jgi:peptide deformylase
MFKIKKRYEVRTAGDKVLAQSAAPVGVINDEIKQLAEKMFQSMVAFDGIGLAAPQYGESLRLIVIDVPLSDEEAQQVTPFEQSMYDSMPMVLINPEITARSGEVSERDEGCLSVPEIYAPVVRPALVAFRAQLLDGSFVDGECGGLLGRCIQHELDHLEGLLFVDRLTPEESRKVRGDLDRLKRIGQTKNFRRMGRK